MTELLDAPEPSEAHDGDPRPTGPAVERFATRDAELGEGFTIRRALPTRHRRLVGAWCFLDHMGPVDVAQGPGLRVGPHPHTGLQTVTWLLEGEILHRDSLGHEQVIRPGECNLMTSGRGISHSEETPPGAPDRLHAVQLWIALPDAVRDGDGDFVHHADLPTVHGGGFTGTVFVGEGLGAVSPAAVHTPLVGAHLAAEAGASARLELDPTWEHAVLVLVGTAVVEDTPTEPGELCYLAPGRDGLDVQAASDVDLVLVGGAPFDEDVLVWWNFVGRTRDEVSAAAHQWNAADERFGTVVGYPGDRVDSPPPPWE